MSSRPKSSRKTPAVAAAAPKSILKKSTVSNRPTTGTQTKKRIQIRLSKNETLLIPTRKSLERELRKSKQTRRAATTSTRPATATIANIPVIGPIGSFIGSVGSTIGSTVTSGLRYSMSSSRRGGGGGRRKSHRKNRTF